MTGSALGPRAQFGEVFPLGGRARNCYRRRHLAAKSNQGPAAGRRGSPIGADIGRGDGTVNQQSDAAPGGSPSSRQTAAGVVLVLGLVAAGVLMMAPAEEANHYGRTIQCDSWFESAVTEPDEALDIGDHETSCDSHQAQRRNIALVVALGAWGLAVVLEPSVDAGSHAVGWSKETDAGES